MTKNNIYLPKENLAKVETVQELKDEYKVPSYEEFMKTYNEDKETVNNYENEFDSYGDIRVKGTYYGPGFWDDFLRPVASAALAISYAIPPLAAVTVPVSIGVGVAGAAMAKLSDDKDVQNAGGQMLLVVGGAAQDHLNDSGVENAHKGRLMVEHIRRNS